MSKTAVIGARQHIDDSFVIDQYGTIRSPGKFDGEACYVPYYWNLFLDGGATRDEGRALTFQVTPDERRQFPELGRRTVVHLIEDDDGVVCEV